MRITKATKLGQQDKTCLKKYGSIALIFVLVVYLLEVWFASVPSKVDRLQSSIKRDYSTIQGIGDLFTEDVGDWCHEARPKCPCKDPLVPEGRFERKFWSEKHQKNVEVAANAKKGIDILFLGDSITEGWEGTSLGQPSSGAKGAPEIFQKYFDSKEAKHKGLVLAVSGDKSQNLLWRLQNGELPDTLNPKVIWVLIGTNDFGVTWCSPELVVIGVLRVLEELKRKRPKATIVVNGLLPRSSDKQGYAMRGATRTKNRPSIPPLWDDITAVNDELRNYVNSQSNMKYVETNVFFVDKQLPKHQLQVNKKLMPDGLHPNAAGYDLWGAEIVKTIDSVMSSRH